MPVLLAKGFYSTYKATRARREDISAMLRRYWTSVALARCMAAGVSPVGQKNMLVTLSS